ncbi:MAG: 1-acyl-sn-glycerol-3-phosphate acyltransferase [Bacilli bacterium]|nr:1-acyl-sn-glycerol-3-phosphate acyltransferase [Bacilli bacterium]
MVKVKKEEKLHFGKVFYYQDELNDDFEETNLKRIELPKDYKYTHRNIFFKLASWILYYFFAFPILGLYSFFGGVKIKGRKNIKGLRKTGCFVYANHVSFYDVFDIQACVFLFKRTNILGYTDALSNKVIAKIVPLIGYKPIPSSIETYKSFMKDLEIETKKGHNTLIYPEAHIWPYYTKIRPYVSASFKYPAKLNAPVIPITNCIRKSKISKRAKITLYIGKPIYPKAELSVKENQEYLRNTCYQEMCDTAAKYSIYEYVKYVKGEAPNENEESD